MNQHQVFVYGTLRKNESNHYLMVGANLIACQAWTHGRLYDTGMGYPALQESKEDQVYGEIYLVSDEQLERLDELEGYKTNGSNNLYDRKKQIVFHDTGTIEAFVYFIDNKNERLLRKYLPSGDWKLEKYHDKRQNLPYFAYGSCMDDRRFQEDGVGHLFQNIAGAGILHNYTLRFTRKSMYDGMGHADIVESAKAWKGKFTKYPLELFYEITTKGKGVGSNNDCLCYMISSYMLVYSLVIKVIYVLRIKIYNCRWQISFQELRREQF